METKSKYRVTQGNHKRPHDTPPSGSGPMGQPSEHHASDEFEAGGQVVEEVTGTSETTSPAGSGTELTEAEGHMRVSNPATSRKQRESTETTAVTEPVVEASLATITSSQDAQEFWGALAGAIGPFIVNTVKKTGISLATSGIKKLSPTLSNMLRREGYSETAIQRLESGQQESGAEEPVVVGREFWEKLASACIPVFRRRPGMYPITYPSILQPKGGINKLSESSQQEAGAESATGEREFWGAIASALAPVLAPVAKQVAGMAIKSGTSLVKSGIRKLFDANDQETGGEDEEVAQQLEALFLQHVAANQQEAGSETAAGEREFFGALAKKLVPVFKPLAQNLASAAAKAGGALVKKISPKLANMLRLEGFSETAIQQLESSQQEAGSESAMGEREFWGVIASALAPVLAPVAKQVAGMAIKSGTSLVKSGIRKLFDANDQETGADTEAAAQQLEALFVQQIMANQQEAGSQLSAGEREFFGALAKKLVPVLMPVAKSVAGAAIKTGTSLVKKMFESSQQESGAETEAAVQQLEALFLQHVEANQHESSTQPTAGEREFFGALAKKLVPILRPIAQNISYIVQPSIKKVSPVLSNMLRQEGFDETTIQQLESSQQEAGAESATGEREFWGAIASALAPVLAPVAKQVAGMAIKSGTSLVKSGIRKLFDANDQETGGEDEEVAQQLEALFLQHVAANQQEAGSETAAGEREFFGALAKKLVPVFKPLAQNLASAAAKAGGALVKKISPKLANMLRLEGFSETAIQQLESSQQEAGSESAMGEREFWGVIASALAPVLAPVAKQVAGMAIKSGTSLVKSGIRKLFDANDQETGADIEDEEVAQQLEVLFLEQVEASQQESSDGTESAAGEREFWGLWPVRSYLY
ncbi:hypothetical protein [Hymenobacter volaticus]|uniref:DUF937 domain-containing protein n=1 Tax=Hymenobacter volaticus TaxID=2932254 RepID=A0ABY4GBF8_9BACT|nr:hypothetical protein [Hymenobacter volaticus]UOQ68249.1 hypothetical protein MUN86_10575 [Hymenobacter volaticus]